MGAYLVALAVVSACATEIDSSDDAEDEADAIAAESDPPELVPFAAITVQRGVDRASVFSTHEARVLHDQHGVRWTGVYIGGPCSGGSGWTKTRVSAIAHATAWKFMPIFVGQQSHAICGAHTLTSARGKADGTAAVSRMKAFGWLPNRDIPVALDVEAGTYFSSPGGSTSYVRAWVNAVHAAGYRAYVYGSPYGLAHYKDAKVRIDAAWAASYFYSGFRSVTPGQLSQMGSRFRNHNRAWQYAGNFHVSGAGLVDANTSDLLLAPRPGGTNRTATSHRIAPAACGALGTGEGLERGESLASCDGQVVLAMSADGELSVTAAGVPVWTAGTAGAGATAVLEDTGELVVFDDGGEPVFTSDTAGFPDAHVELATDGLALVDDDGTTVWSSRKGLLVFGDDGLEDDASARE